MQMQAYVMHGCWLKSIKATFILKMVCRTIVTRSWVNPSTKLFVFQKGIEMKFVIRHMTSPIKVTSTQKRKCIKISVGHIRLKCVDSCFNCQQKTRALVKDRVQISVIPRNPVPFSHLCMDHFLIRQNLITAYV